jgi:putative ABC transport system permease protein
MIGLQSRLFVRIMARNREVFLLKIITLAIAFASSILITLFALNEFGYDRFHENPNAVFRVVQKNVEKQHTGNRLSVKIPPVVFGQLNKAYKDSLVISRVKIMNQVTVRSGRKTFPDQKVHAADPAIGRIFSFDVIHGNMKDFNNSNEVMAMLSEQAARRYAGTPLAIGKQIKLYTSADTVEVKVAAVFKDFPKNSHEDFDVFIAFNNTAITALDFDPEERGVYGRALISNPEHYKNYLNGIASEPEMVYSLQPLPQLYFGPRILGEDARHGDSYSVIILICITSLILFLALTSFVNLTTITLPHRSKELAVKKLAGTSQANLLFTFLRESFTLVGISFLTGLLIIAVSRSFIESTLNFPVLPLILQVNIKLILIVAILFIILVISPVFMTRRFVQATPSRLLGTDTITFPGLKRLITFLQLGISTFLIIASVVVHRQINYSLVKEPGHNHDQIVYLSAPSGIAREDIMALRSNWTKDNPNILDVMAVSQLPNLICSKEIGYLLQVDPGFREFFDLKMKEGNWFGPNAGDSVIVVNKSAKDRMEKNQANVIGVVEDVSGLFNQPEKPVKIKLAWDYYYSWLCVRVLEVDIRNTIIQLSRQFSVQGVPTRVNYLNKNFKSWIDYQDRLNMLSEALAMISGLLSCCAIYGLSVSLVRDKLKQIAVHKLLGARTLDITYLLVTDFVKQMAIALAVFGPLSYILLNELLRTFVFSTKFSWLDPLYPVAYCAFIIVAICGFQALSLNRTDFASALKD